MAAFGQIADKLPAEQKTTKFRILTPRESIIIIIIIIIIIARDRIYAKRAYAIAIPSVRLSVRPSVTLVIHAKMVEVRILQFSPYSSPIPLVFAR